MSTWAKSVHERSDFAIDWTWERFGDSSESPFASNPLVQKDYYISDFDLLSTLTPVSVPLESWEEFLHESLP